MRKVAAGTLAGIAAGMLTGLAARVAMRMVADGVPDGIGQRPDFTVAGTATILLAGAIAGAPSGAIYAALEPALRVQARLRGLAFAGLLLVVLGPAFLAGDELFSTGRVLLFATLFPIFGIAVGLALPLAHRVEPRLSRNASLLLVAIAIGAGALVAAGLVGVVVEMVTNHGPLAALPAVAPWILLAAFAAFQLRARLIGAQVIR